MCLLFITGTLTGTIYGIIYDITLHLSFRLLFLLNVVFEIRLYSPHVALVHLFSLLRHTLCVSLFCPVSCGGTFSLAVYAITNTTFLLCT